MMESAQKKVLLLIAAVIAATVVITTSSCGESTSTDTVPIGHRLSTEEQERIVSETIDDLNQIAAVETDTSALAAVMTGDALNEMKTGIDKALAEGKIKKRDYQNVTATFVQFDSPYAQVSAEFDDFSYYVDAKTGAELTQPSGTHMKYAMAIVEEDGRWKIRGIYPPSTPETPQQLPQTTGTTGALQ